MVLNLEIKKKTIASILMFTWLLLLFERLYMPKGTTTGLYNKYTTLLFLVLLLGFYFILKKENENINIKIQLFVWGAVLGILISQLFFGGELKETLRYINLIFIGVLVGQLPRININVFCRFIICVAFFFTILDLFQGKERVTGFLMTSPTLFSFCVLVAITYLIYTPKKLFDIALIVIATWIIYKTGSRSTLFVEIMFITIYFVKKLPKNKYVRIFRILIIFFSAFGILYLAQGILNGNYFVRDSSIYSNMTRVSFLNTGMEYLNSNPLGYLIGSGAGYSYELITNQTGMHIPIHFDILAALIDYGVFGLAFMLLFPLVVSKKWVWQGWVLLFLGSIHNLLLFPIGFALVILISNQLGQYSNGLNAHEST